MLLLASREEIDIVLHSIQSHHLIMEVASGPVIGLPINLTLLGTRKQAFVDIPTPNSNIAQQHLQLALHLLWGYWVDSGKLTNNALVNLGLLIQFWDSSNLVKALAKVTNRNQFYTTINGFEKTLSNNTLLLAFTLYHSMDNLINIDNYINTYCNDINYSIPSYTQSNNIVHTNYTNIVSSTQTNIGSNQTNTVLPQPHIQANPAHNRVSHNTNIPVTTTFQTADDFLDSLASPITDLNQNNNSTSVRNQSDCDVQLNTDNTHTPHVNSIQNVQLAQNLHIISTSNKPVYSHTLGHYIWDPKNWVGPKRGQGRKTKSKQKIYRYILKKGYGYKKGPLLCEQK